MRHHRVPTLLLLFVALSLPWAAAQRRISGRNVGQAPRNGGGLGRGVPLSGGGLPHAEDEGNVEFRSQTILVQVPVVVTDKSGGHMHGLSQEDFEVLENGKEQKIAAFEEVESSRTPFLHSTSEKGVFSNLAVTQEKPRSITLIALDTVNTPFLDQAYGRKQLIKYLADHATPDQVIGLVAITGQGLKVLHNFTADPAALIQALKKLSGELPTLQGVDIDTQSMAASSDPSTLTGLASMSASQDPEAAMEDFVMHGDAMLARMQQDRAIEITMRAFLNLAHSVAGIPGRKSLLWATGSFPFYIDSPSSIPSGFLGPLYEQAMEALNDAEVSVYPVDVRGLVNYSPAADASFRGSRNGAGFSNTLAARSWLHNASLDTLRDFAEMTGGKAFYNSNDIAGGFQRAVDDSSSYYLLGYYLDTKNTKAGWRHLKVKLHKPGTEVRARSGFFVTNATMNPAASKKDDIDMALTSPFESTGIPLDVRWTETKDESEKKKVGFSVHVAPAGITVDAAARNNFTMEFVTLVAQSGKAVKTTGQTVQGEMKPATLAQVQAGGLSYNNFLELPAGQYTVRFVVRDNLNGKMGSVSAPLTVN